MPTTTDLTATLANALGLPRLTVNETARHLREAEMLPEGKERASVEHAVTLLLALMAAPDPKDAPDCARLYLQLPFDRVMRYETMLDGRFGGDEAPDDDPFVSDIRKFDPAFGPFLETLIHSFNMIPEISVEPPDISIGGGLGTAMASVRTLLLADDVNVSVNIQFTLEPMGGNQMPDDAPAGRLDRYTTVRGLIFTTLRQFFTDSADGPREVFLTSRPAPALMSQEES